MSLTLLVAVPAISSSLTWPAAKLLSSGMDLSRITQWVAATLTRCQLVLVGLTTGIVGIQLLEAGDTLPAAIAVAGATFFAGIMWNEVLLDCPMKSTSRSIPDAYPAVLTAYYAVMTRTSRGLNLSSLALCIGATLGALVVQLLDPNIEKSGTIISLAIMVGLLAFSGTHTWPAAVRIGSGSADHSELNRIARPLGLKHLAFVASLLTVATIQIATLL
ncbi:hypothetical protein ACFVAV_18440 [Nocardia sp. NPDC057663]|uniref:hypothetical protein n=1 Tax=Nocardia sp. NPDC057663 TaxID=3346201 RepID=UPI00366E8F03